MYKLLILFITSYFIVIGLLYAAPVDVPTEIQGLEGNIFNDKKLGIGLSIAAEADFLGERKLGIEGSEEIAKVKGQFYTSKIILTVINKFDIYGIFGKAENLEYKDSGIKLKPKDKLTWGVGVSVPIYEWKNCGIKLFADGKYRAVNNIDYFSNYQSSSSSSPSSYDGSSYYGGSSTVPKFLVNWQEWQVAFGVAKKFKYFMPYGGIKYSDFRESSINSINYSDAIIGIFIGCAITPIKAFSIDLQGRFIDENAFAVKATYKF